MILVFILLTNLLLCWSGKPIDYTPLLKYLDDEIILDLSEPLEGRGDILKKSVKKYNNRLIDTRDMIQQDVYEAYVKAVELQKIGGPQFLKTSLDSEHLKKVYSWKDDDVSSLRQQFETTKQFWKEVESEFETAVARFKSIHEADAKEKAEMAEREREKVEKLKKAEEEFNKRVTVNLGTAKPDDMN